MRRWLRRHKMVQLAHPVRVQRAVVWRRQRAQRARRGRGARPCWRCGYELLGLPELVCPECGTRHEAGWYRGRWRAGGWWRRGLVGVIGVVGAPAFVLGLQAVLMSFGLTRAANAPMTPAFWVGGTLGVVALLAGLIGFFGWSRSIAGLLWGPVVRVRVGLEVACVVGLLGALGFSVVWWELIRLVG